MNIYSFSSIVASIFCLVLGSFIFVKMGRDKKCKIFGFATILTGLWTLFPFVLSRAHNESSALFLARVIYIPALFNPPAWMHFILTLVKDRWQWKEKILLSLCYGFSALFIFVIFTPLFIRGVNRFAPHFSVVPGPAFIFFVAIFAGIIGYAIKIAFSYYKVASGYRRNQLKFILVSFIFGLLSGLFHFGAAYLNKELFPHDFLLIAFISLIAYAIIKHRLMDITLTITRTSVFVAVYTLVLGLPFIFANLGKDRLLELLGINWWIGPMILMAILGTLGPFIYIFFEKRAEGIILREQHRYQQTLKQAAREIARIHNLQKLLNLIVHIVTRTVGICYSAVYLFEEENKQFALRASRNLKKQQPFVIAQDDTLIIWLKDHLESLVYEEIRRKAEESPESVFKDLEEQMRFLNATVIVPGFLENRLLGFLILGDKRSGRIYTTEDLNTFSVLASQSALAIENALLYENIEEKVRQRTDELVDVQKQLVQAEKLATMGTLAGGVAHEINNPLTAILANVQMLLMDDASDSKLDRESLELIEEGTKRCREIVQKLMVYARKPLESSQIGEVDLLEALEDVTFFLKYQLEQENVKIISKVKDGKYFVEGNRNEIKQVITNLILNAKDAIKKVKKGGNIHISLSKDKSGIKIKVKDEGRGISKEVIPKIFDPFFTTKDVGKGLGLGLSISQAIVGKHSGTIVVQSEHNKGSVFTVQLPAFKEKVKSGSNV